ncbi:hypothetical protein DL98DRAFT_119911 [Cadophora sp. DSE1049]|nr:hypothetical protein DL98DRAFT_119911 [Cadophora sp. DSE1049]
MVKAYANLYGLAQFCVRDQRLPSVAALSTFWAGFSRSSPLVDFVDVGPGKEEADSKLRQGLVFYITNPQCTQIMLICCHDGGYVPVLRQIRLPSIISSKNHTSIYWRYPSCHGEPGISYYRYFRALVQCNWLSSGFRSRFDQPSSFSHSNRERNKASTCLDTSGGKRRRPGTCAESDFSKSNKLRAVFANNSESQGGVPHSTPHWKRKLRCQLRPTQTSDSE